MKKLPLYIFIIIALAGILSPVTIAAQTDTSYYLLEPLPCNGTEAEGCVGGKLVSFDTGSDSNNKTPALGRYLNFAIKLFIGLCAVLAVVMIVIGGIEYMTSELISSKEAGKERIRGALLGLLLALCSYTILFTINPDLLNTDLEIGGVALNVELQNFIIEEEDYTEAVPSDSGALPTGRRPGCGSSMVKTKSGIYACEDIAQNLDNMIDAAKKEAGLNITGGGHRTAERQKELRIKYCNGNYTDRNARCSRPTALPGESRHQSGLAFDLNCNGRIIPKRGPAKSSNPCFIWLQANASKYHLYNLPSEGWHWSTDGQ